MVGGLRLRGAGPPRLGSPGDAAAGPLGRRLGGLERLRGGATHRGGGSGVTPARRADRVPRGRERGPLGRLLVAAAGRERPGRHRGGARRGARGERAAAPGLGRAAGGVPLREASTRPRWRNLARRAGRGPVHTFTLAFEEEEFNEGHAARAIAGGDRHRAPGGPAHRAALPRRRWSRRWTASTSPPSTGSTPTSCPVRCARRASPWPWWARAATSCSAATPASTTSRCCSAGRGASAGCRARRWSGWRSWRWRRSSASTGPSPGRPDGPSCRRWCGGERTCSRSTSSPTRCSSPSSSGSCWAPSWPRRWWTGSRRSSAPGSRREVRGRSAAGGDQRAGAAAVPRRAAAPRQRRGEHGRLHRAAPAAGGPGPARDRAPAPGRHAVPAGAAQGACFAGSASAGSTRRSSSVRSAASCSPTTGGFARA